MKELEYLRETYRAVFVVELDQDENAFERVSYSYADILTEAVEITILDGADPTAFSRQIITAFMI